MQIISQASLLLGVLGTAVASAGTPKPADKGKPKADATAKVEPKATAGASDALTPYPPQSLVSGGSAMQPCGNAKAPPKPGEKFPTYGCEPGGSNVATAANLIHFRIETATKAKASDKVRCQREAQAAVAASQGVVKFRDELKKAKTWTAGLTYRTRYDGDLDEDKLFESMAKSGDAATKLFTACGGTKLAISTQDEMAFKASRQTPADYSKPMLTLHNQDGVEHDYVITCPSGASARGAIIAHGTSYEGSNMKGCTITIDDKASLKAPGDVDCDIRVGAVSCR